MANKYYPASTPYKTGYLKVDPVHDLYYEEFGNPNGVPIVYLHGGPGGGHGPNFHRFFDPTYFRIIIYDQRGAGQSKPFCNLTNNTPDDLVEDMEKLRDHLGINRWHVFGGSWGSTLGLLYGEAHPEKVLSLTLRGIFMVRQKELDAFYQRNELFPDEHKKLLAYIPESEHGDVLKAYWTRITAGDLEAARTWARYEDACSFMEGPPSDLDTEDNKLIGMATIETHFFMKCKFQPDDRILQNIHVIRDAGIQVKIVQGRYDSVCPPFSALELKDALPDADLQLTMAGHAGMDPANLSALIDATNNIRDTGSPLPKTAQATIQHPSALQTPVP